MVPSKPPVAAAKGAAPAATVDKFIKFIINILNLNQQFLNKVKYLFLTCFNDWNKQLKGRLCNNSSRRSGTTYKTCNKA